MLVSTSVFRFMVFSLPHTVMGLLGGMMISASGEKKKEKNIKLYIAFSVQSMQEGNHTHLSTATACLLKMEDNPPSPSNVIKISAQAMTTIFKLCNSFLMMGLLVLLLYLKVMFIYITDMIINTTLLDCVCQFWKADTSSTETVHNTHKSLHIFFLRLLDAFQLAISHCQQARDHLAYSVVTKEGWHLMSVVHLIYVCVSVYGHSVMIQCMCATASMYVCVCVCTLRIHVCVRACLCLPARYYTILLPQSTIVKKNKK